jgi:hypothetical protein
MKKVRGKITRYCPFRNGCKTKVPSAAEVVIRTNVKKNLATAILVFSLADAPILIFLLLVGDLLLKCSLASEQELKVHLQLKRQMF